MKTINYVFFLLIFPLLLSAQDKHGYFPLQPGDWFEMQVTMGNENGPYTTKEPTFLPNFRFQLRYHLIKQLQDGKQQYKIELERTIVHTTSLSTSDEGWMGYDSYYPPYKQQQSRKTAKGAYLLEISSDGSIISLTKDSLHLPPRIITYDNSAKKWVNMYRTVTVDPMTADQVKDIVRPILAHRELTRRINDPSLEYAQLLIAASFPIPGNVVIQSAEQVTITSGDSTWKCVVNSDGSFSRTIFITRPQQAEISSGDHHSHLFLMPGDTLFLNKQWAFSGNAAINSQLADNIDKQFGETLNPAQVSAQQTLSDVLLSEEKETATFNAIIKNYQDKATPVCIDYFKTYWQYRIACDRLFFLSQHNYQANGSLRPFQDIPTEVTAAIDNLPVVLNPYPQEPFYKSYISQFVSYQQARISLATGGNSESFGFYADYSAILSTLKGYPLYFKLKESIDNELKQSSWTTNRRLQPYFEDFINNCEDSTLTAPLIKNWQLMERWAPGNPLPIKLTMANGKTYDLNTQNKTTCLLIDFYGQVRPADYLKLVNSHPKVHFVYAWIQIKGMENNKDQLIRNLPNVTVIELKNDEEKNYELYGIDVLHNNFIVLDQWGKMMDDHITGTDDEWKDLNDAIKKATNSPQFSKTQKANVMNIIGWSLGSILITALIGLWIYRVRIRRIKLKNTIQQLEIKAIRSQMNPHFIFNALNSIQSLINTAQYKAANTYLVKFSMLLRSVLNNSEKNTLPLLDELFTIKLYCELEQLRFDFSFEMDIEEDIDLVEIPGMIIQPLIENAIIHGLASKGKDGYLLIKIEKQHESLKISVYDNGAEFQPSSSSHKSLGLKLVKQRLQLFGSASLEYNISNGTTAILTIPIEAA
ncbi:Histidine kinase [Chitinophaga sp. YR573]|uniref:sensor histidine kinase n=1 Tax=Chitinophaga sp. YR573 TaxID=1881040 RepID=UPI0008D873A6|nr:histidine kinase [Chitinophaga sp. YR573]SEW28759.1 Histidine kinase [Chitinophaga sp. YR573]